MSFEQLDDVRRMQGATLDAIGLGPLETPHTVAHSESGVALRRYGGDTATGPIVLIVPAPIKRPYIWDLAPDVSVVRRCLAGDARVFLVDWQSAAPHFGLTDYAGRLILDCRNAAGGERAILLGHSLGVGCSPLFSRRLTRSACAASHCWSRRSTSAPMRACSAGWPPRWKPTSFRIRCRGPILASRASMPHPELSAGGAGLMLP